MPPFLLFLAGVAVGVGAAVLAPGINPELSRSARPLAKSLIRSALAASRDMQVVAAEIVENAEDLYAETLSEMKAERTAAKAAARRPAATGTRRKAKKPARRVAPRRGNA